MKLRKRRVCVLGAGPSGLLAAFAAENMGYEVTVLSRAWSGEPIKSDLYGCQYLHNSIPGITGEPVTVRYLLNGSGEQYREKVYGAAWGGAVSPDEYGPQQEHQAWDLRAAYDKLWKRWSARIVPAHLDPVYARALSNDRHVLVLSTVPLPVLCSDPEQHKFHTQDIWAMGTAPGNELPYRAPENTVECNGHDSPRWYRAATVFGHSTLEWPAGVKPPVSGVASVRKPLKTDCDCWQGKSWHRLGRYGQWRKGVLVHQAYDQTVKVLA